MKKIKLINCLEKRDFKNCWKKVDEMKDYTNPSSSPDRSELRFYVNERLLVDGSNVCGNQEIKIYHKGLERFGVDHMTVKGPGMQNVCENNISAAGEEIKTYSLAGFLCGGKKPPEGRYSV